MAVANSVPSKIVMRGTSRVSLNDRFGQVPVVELGEFDDEKPKPVVVMQQIPTRVTQPSVGVIGKMRADQYENEKLLRAQTAFAGGGGSGGISARFATLPANEELLTAYPWQRRDNRALIRQLESTFSQRQTTAADLFADAAGFTPAYDDRMDDDDIWDESDFTSPVYHRNRQLTRPRFETGRVQKRYAPQSSIVLTPNGLYTSRYAPYTSGRMRGFGRGGRQYGGSRGWRDDDFGGGGYRYRGARGGRMNRVESIMRRTKSVNDIYQPLSFYTGEREFTNRRQPFWSSSRQFDDGQGYRSNYSPRGRRGAGRFGGRGGRGGKQRLGPAGSFSFVKYAKDDEVDKTIYWKEAKQLDKELDDYAKKVPNATNANHVVVDDPMH